MPDPILPSRSSFTFKLIAYIHYLFPLSQLCTQLVRLSSHLGRTWPTAPTACSMFPVPCPHPRAGSAWGGMVATRCHPPVLAGCSWGTHPSIVPKNRLHTAGASAFGNCIPRLRNSLTANHAAKHRLQRFPLLKHVGQHSWHSCPFNLTAPRQPRRGKAVL